MYKKVNKIIKKIFFLALFAALLGFPATIFAAEAMQTEEQDSSTLMGDLDLEKVPHAWINVLSGTALTRPVKTSYGYAVLTDGKMVTSITEGGKIIWQKGIPFKPENFIAASPDDFLAVPLKNKKLTVLNQHGTVVWTSTIGFDVKSAPLFGRDGRIFVFGKQEAACFGVNGTRKWTTTTDPQNESLPKVQLPDGSIVVFLEKEEEGKTVGVRLSPFGESLERIVFAGRILNAYSCTDGALLAFGDGTLGLCKVDSSKNAAISAWIIPGMGINAGVKFCDLDSDVLYAAASPDSKGVQVHILNTRSAKLIRTFTVPEINSLTYMTYSPDGIFLSNAPTAVIYTSSGRRVRGIKFPLNKKKNVYDYVLYGTKGMAIFTSRSWTITGWRILQPTPPKKPAQKAYAGYKTFYAATNDDYSRMYEAPKDSRRAALKRGDYAALEREFWKDSQFVLDEYFTQKTTQLSRGSRAFSDEEPYFDLHQQTEVVSMLGLFETRDGANAIYKILNIENDETVLIKALKAIQDSPYDPEGNLIKALEVLAKNTNPRQEVLLGEICETLYSLCRFMGKKVFYEKTLAIASNLSLPQYRNSTKENARKIYEKLAEIK